LLVAVILIFVFTAVVLFKSFHATALHILISY